ncbi:MAG: MFS transporter [Candidatus Bathyarchaeota archaeon]|nr:MFS transporter [Candidatus Bathyarchaeota archaeon]
MGKIENGLGKAPSSSPEKVAAQKFMSRFLGPANSSGWVNAVLPFNIALGPVSTLIPLLILNLNGSVVEVGLALTLFNAVGIPAALFWGFITDRFHRRRPLVLVSFLVTALILALFPFARTGYWVSFLYALFSFSTTASTTPLNLLVMETEQKPRWASAFAKFSMFSSVGQTVGLLLGMVWSVYAPLVYLVIPLAVSSLVSAGLAAFMIKEPEVVFERKAMVMHKHSFFHRLRHSPYLFLKVPSGNDFKRMFRNLRHEFTRHTPLLYMAIFGFFLSAGIFNTSLIPALKLQGVSSLLIFCVIMLGLVVQIVSFRFAGPYTERKSPVKSAIGGLLLRAVAYGMLGVCAYFLTGLWFLLPVMICYPLASGLAYSIYYTASNTMVFNTLSPRRNGSALGVYSALAGFATMAGSFVSGFLSFYGGFYVTFIVSAACLVVSAWLLTHLEVLMIPNQPQR